MDDKIAGAVTNVATDAVAGKTVYFLGKLAGLNRQEAAQVVRRAGGRVTSTLGATVQILVVGDDDILTQDWNLWNDRLDDATREAFEAGSLEIVSEAAFWDKLGRERPSKSHYTSAMLAELAGLPLSTVRRLHRLGLISPIRRVYRLCYFDFESILPLKIIRDMLDAGMSLQRAVDRFRRASRFFSSRHRSDSPVDVRLAGGDLLFSTSRGLVDQDGQRRFDFALNDAPDGDVEGPLGGRPSNVEPLAVLDDIFHHETSPGAEPNHFETLRESAWMLESTGNLRGALDLYRAALAACPDGPTPYLHFQVAELLYRLGDLTAARERYYMVIELDETFVEARANLGCVLAELGCDELAEAALRGALKYHPDYAEVHFHLGMLLHRTERDGEAARHFQIFLELMPDSPWVERIPATKYMK